MLLKGTQENPSIIFSNEIMCGLKMRRTILPTVSSAILFSLLSKKISENIGRSLVTTTKLTLCCTHDASKAKIACADGMKMVVLCG